MKGKKPQNIVFLVWDACRSDYADREAPTLSSLGEENIRFHNAIAPATYSLPSHASLFTGEYTTEHGLYALTDSMKSVPLISDLLVHNYRTYGVSANGFAGPRMGLNDFFDEFYFTGGQEPFPEGFNVYERIYEHRSTESSTTNELIVDTARSVLTHDHRLKSILNLGAVAVGQTATKVGPLQHIPHNLFSPHHGFSYHPRKNTERILDIFEREAERERPFFLFANYMDTHRPYNPPAEYRGQHLEGSISWKELSRLNEEVEAPWAFIESEATGTIDDRDIERVRSLYAGEVNSVDSHLGHILNTLERLGLRDETLIVVTADHGENLGEVDALGDRRMGHEGSVSEHLLRVPLVVAHPSLDSEVIERVVSIKDLYDLFTAGRRPTNDDVKSSLLLDGPIFAHYPPPGGGEIFEKHPGVPGDARKARISESTTVAYRDDWKIITNTTGERWAFKSGEQIEYDSAPSDVRQACEKSLEKLDSVVNEEEGLSEVDRSQLEALGYL